ncbi:PKD domain containing protein [Catellatospora tritici]|uniref:PKD domain containing protein n=1 Tax=Catellatospora tritici TaxID=2851566 RepID=UPI001C2D30B2|nr:PKD domain containing protein [Catellatospora tritici]MBV1855181.1 PKD domain containing protein [Catellatospora tritici]
MRRNIPAQLTVLAAIGALLAAPTGPAYAEPVPTGPVNADPVSADPVDWTPHITDGEVWALAQVGDTVVVGGHFTTVTSADGKTTYKRKNLMAFRLADGAVVDFAPKVDGTVHALATGPADTVIVGGDFGKVNDIIQRTVTRLDLTTGDVVPGFTAPVKGEVFTLARSGSRLYIGGRVYVDGRSGSRGLVRLDVGTGAVDKTFDVELTASDDRPVKVQDLTISADGAHMMALGTFTEVNGHARSQVAMFDIVGPAPVLTGWRTDFYGADACSDEFNTYLRAADFDPTGTYVVVVTSGHTSRIGLPCDTATRFETDPATRRPTWINYTGGNSLYAVEVTDAAVYVGGHLQWLDNPYGNKTKGAGAVNRKGIGAIDPTTGQALPWNPGRTRGEGLRAFLVSGHSLVVGSDTDQLGHEYHGRIGLFPER